MWDPKNPFNLTVVAADSTIKKALDWIVSNFKKYAIKVVNISLGGGSYGGEQTNGTLSADFQKLHDLGIAVFAVRPAIERIPKSLRIACLVPLLLLAVAQARGYRAIAADLNRPVDVKQSVPILATSPDRTIAVYPVRVSDPLRFDVTRIMLREITVLPKPEAAP